MTQLNDPHDNGAATAAPDDAPDSATATPAADAGSSPDGQPPEPMTPAAWQNAHWSEGDCSRWHDFRRQITLLIVAHELVHRASVRLRRLSKGHPCSIEQGKLHACGCCGRADPAWQDCDYCRAEQIAWEQGIADAKWAAEDFSLCAHHWFAGPLRDAARQVERFVDRMLDIEAPPKKPR